MSAKNLMPSLFAVVLFYFASPALACKLEENEYGYQFTGVDCFKIDPQYGLRAPNLVVTGAGTSIRYGKSFSMSATVRNKGTADTDKPALKPLPNINGSHENWNGAFDTSVQIHVKDLQGNMVMFFDRLSSQWVYFANWNLRSPPLMAGGFRHVDQPLLQASPNILYRFELPDIDITYDVCIQAWVDPPSPTYPLTEIRESNEQDNLYYGFSRLPGYRTQPDFRNSSCFYNW